MIQSTPEPTSSSVSRITPMKAANSRPPRLLGSSVYFIRRHQLIAQPAHGLDLRRAPGKLIAQPRDVDVDGAAIPQVGIAPHPAQERLAREHAALFLRQGQQQVELLGAQLDWLAADADLPAGRVDVDVADVERH